MTKKEFLDTLGGRLAQMFSREKVAEHIRYYDQYIEEKKSQGFSEEEAVNELGDPLLIARTIMDTDGAGGGRSVIYEETEGTKQGWSVEEEHQSGGRRQQRQISIQSRTGCLLTVIVVILIVTLILKLIGSVVSFFLPILIPVLLIAALVSRFKKS